ncbi:MAG: hypothetical protein Q8Q25_01725 [bacterium]|nr:hypothetical protein [bacterium]
MKKILLFSFCILVSAAPAFLLGTDLKERDSCFSTAFSAGYVFKHDSCFKEVYGHGVINIITADGCYYPWQCWGVGAKVSYWRAKGKTTFLKQCSLLREVPVTFYLRAIKEFPCCLQLYTSLGGGFVWIKEKSYLGNVRLYKGIGELEVGLNYPIWRFINITGVFRYLFPPQSQSCEKVDVGGFDLRAGIGFSF